MGFDIVRSMEKSLFWGLKQSAFGDLLILAIVHAIDRIDRVVDGCYLLSFRLRQFAVPGYRKIN
jgi:hypothetical protein